MDFPYTSLRTANEPWLFPYVCLVFIIIVVFRAFPKTFIHRHSELGGHADGRREEDGSFGGDVSGSETSVDEHVVSSDVG